MPEPHEVLELPADAAPETVRRRYLELARRYPPERAPERFAAIRQAYEALRDPVDRLERRLFEPEGDESFASLVEAARVRLRSRRLTTDELLRLAERV